MKTIDDVIEQCEEIANASKQHTLHMTHFSQSYDEWAEEWTQIAEWLKELKELRVRYSQLRRDCNETIDVIEKLRDELKAYKEQSGDAVSRQAVLDAMYDLCDTGETLKENPWRDNPHIDAIIEAIDDLPSVTPQQRTGRCKDCKYFEYDSVAKVDGIPLIVAHEICKRWGDGCKSKEDGYCFLFEPKMQEVQDADSN